MHYLNRLLLVCVCVTMAGCGTLGPHALPQNREDFNTALQRSDEEQSLLNLVRMQYSDRPYFLGVSGISAQLKFDAGLDASWQLENQHSHIVHLLTDTYSLAPSVSYEDKPTISYTPLQGEKFTRQMLTPISLKDIYLLVQSGWTITRVMRLTVQAIGNITNATGSTHPNLDRIPEYQQFLALANLLQEAELDDTIDIGLHKTGDDMSIVLLFKNHKTAKAQQETRMLISLLGTRPQHSEILLSSNIEFENIPGVVPIQTRSLMGIMYYISKSVQYSQDDLKTGVVVQPHYPNGQVFDWRQVTRGLMRIDSSLTRPSNAAVKVYYRYRWFYIADNDSASKQTMALLQQLFSIQSGDISTANVPLLTLGV